MTQQLWMVVVAALLAGCTGAGHEHGPQDTYASERDSPIRGLSEREIEDLRTGAGMRMALPAELNGFPGPKHVIELQDQLNLNETQRERVRALYERTNQEARRVGEQVLAAYEALDQWFRSGAGPAEELDGLLAEVGEQEAELRAVHLAAHLECKDLLTPHQVEVYKELRGYGGDHSNHTSHQ